MARRILGVVGAAVVVAVIPAAARGTQSHAPTASTVWDSVYTASQAARGETAYVKTCARCHQASLGGADQSPPLAGSAFLGNWNGQPLSDLQDRIRKTMPPDSVGIYERPLVTDVIAYMLKANGFPAGGNELPPETAKLREIVLQAEKP